MKVFKTWVRFYYDQDFEVEAENEEEAYRKIDKEARTFPVYSKDLNYEISTTDFEEFDQKEG